MDGRCCAIRNLPFGTSFRMGQEVSKGLSGFHLYVNMTSFQNSTDPGRNVERSEKNSYQLTYQDTGRPV